MASKLRIALLQSKMRGPSGEKVISEQLLAGLSAHPEVRDCRCFITSGFPGGSTPIVSDDLLNEIQAFKPDVLFVFSIWAPPIPLACFRIFYHVNMWRGGHDHTGTPEELGRLGYDLYLTNSRITAEKLQQAGCNAVYWPLFTDPAVFRPTPPAKEFSCDVAYIGGNMSFKTPEVISRYLEPCSQFDFNLYGLDWELHPKLKQFSRGILPEGKIHEVYSSAKVIIGFNAPSQARWGMINNRVFEVLSCEGCLLSDRLPEVEREFAGACAFTDGGEDTARKIRFLLANPEKRLHLGKAGRQIILQRHTARQRVQVLLTEIAKLQAENSARAGFWTRIFKLQKGRPAESERVSQSEAPSDKSAPLASPPPALCFKHHTLRDKTAEAITGNPWLIPKFNLLDLTEPFGTPISAEMWPELPKTHAVGLVWGMKKYGAAEFVDYARQIGLPYVFAERSPLLLRGRKSYYFDPLGTTDHGLLCLPEFIAWLSRRTLSEAHRRAMAAYRQSYAGQSNGVDIQNAPFVGRDEIMQKLAFPVKARLLFVPLQVDDDMTIIDKQSSPFINNMQQFVTLLVNNVDHLPEDYRVVVKEHPANIRYNQELAHDFSHPRIAFIRDEVNVNALTQQCDAIFSVNSGVGMEGLVFHKPLISCGNSFYSGKGINRDVRSEAEIRAAFRGLEDFAVDPERIDRFLHFFIFEYCYDLTISEDSERLAAKLLAIAREDKTPLESFLPSG